MKQSTVLSLGGFSRLNIHGVLPLSPNGDYFWSSTLPAAKDTGWEHHLMLLWWLWRWPATIQPLFGVLVPPGAWLSGGFPLGLYMSVDSISPVHVAWPNRAVLLSAMGPFAAWTGLALTALTGDSCIWLLTEFSHSLSYCVIVKE